MGDTKESTRPPHNRRKQRYISASGPACFFSHFISLTTITHPPKLILISQLPNQKLRHGAYPRTPEDPHPPRVKPSCPGRHQQRPLRDRPHGQAETEDASGEEEPESRVERRPHSLHCRSRSPNSPDGVRQGQVLVGRQDGGCRHQYRPLHGGPQERRPCGTSCWDYHHQDKALQGELSR